MKVLLPLELEFDMGSPGGLENRGWNASLCQHVLQGEHYMFPVHSYRPGRSVSQAVDAVNKITADSRGVWEFVSACAAK